MLKADGSELAQLVPLQFKAWAQCAFNGRALSLEIEGVTANGLSDTTLAAAALIAAWTCRTYAIPPTWAKGGAGRGICQHHDLGEAGGGHTDCSPVGSPTWLKLEQLTQEAYAALGAGPLPAFALHGLPAPHQTELPPSVAPEPTHGGMPRNQPGDVVAHPTSSGYPLASISDWQWRLRKVGANPVLLIDNDEGGATRLAIETFQRAYGLPVTNEVNPATWAALFAATK